MKRRFLSLLPKKYIGLLDCLLFRPLRCYSQHGEDVIAVRYFDYHGPRKGVYVDIGCFHPMRHSVTYLLHKKGWHGVNIDVEPYKVSVFKIARPSDINLCVAVSDKRGTADLFYSPESVYGSMEGLDEDTVRDEASGLGRSVEKRVVSTMPLADILLEHKIAKVDFLTIDVEGHEPAILRDFDFNAYPIPLISVEIQGRFDDVRSNETHKLLVAAGYSTYARTGPTMFYVREGAMAQPDS